MTLVEPGARGKSLALRTMPVATGVVSDLDMAAAVAARDMATERRGATSPDRRDDLELAEAQTAGVGGKICLPMPTKDVCDLEDERHDGAVFRLRGASSERALDVADRLEGNA